MLLVSGIILPGKAKFPDYKKKQKLLYIQKTSPKVLSRIADSLLAEGRVNEAIDYLEKLRDDEKLKEIKKEALESGDLFSFERVVRILEEEITQKEWESLGDQAMQDKKYRYAQDAYRKAGAKDKTQRAEEEAKFEPDSPPQSSE